MSTGLAEAARETVLEDAAPSIYEPRRLKQYVAAVILVLIGAFIGSAPLRDLAAWRDSAAAPNPVTVFAGVVALLCFGFGLLVLLGAARGLPRLTASPLGLRLDTAFGSTWADWQSVGPFDVRTVYAGYRRRVASGRAAITGNGVNRSLRRRRQLTLPDAFHAPLDAIVADLNRRRARALGLSEDAPAAASDPADRFGVSGFTRPWLTFAIVAALVGVFTAELILAIEPPGPLLGAGTKTLLALGALHWTAVLNNGEWCRLFTAPLLHLDLNHLVLNGIALLLVGYVLERLVGRLWFLAFFVIGALGGSLLSLALNPATLISVGASGAIMGLFAAAFIGGFRLPAGTLERSRIQVRSIRVLVPSLLPLATATASGAQIDYAAHLGGAVAGGAAALLLLWAWPDTARLPPFRKLAAAVAAAGLLLAAVGVAQAGSRYAAFRHLPELIPEAQLPKTDDAARSDAARLVARYPGDPRAHFYASLARIAAQDAAGAETELRSALRQIEALRGQFRPSFENTVRGILAAVLIDQHRADEAKAIMRPACSATDIDRPSAGVQKLVAEAHLCD